MTEVTPQPLKTQGFHHFFILLFYDHPAGRGLFLLERGVTEESAWEKPAFWPAALSPNASPAQRVAVWKRGAAE
ncbi:MAG: hypothetical protein MR327_08330 [Clostridiales bacterium]|nr:hypothetical protein [Clostridiales bacterium]